ncbi:MAG TPA: ATP-binding cassette domain-containing protein [Caldilineae bacterium]|nr:ATP-binding cassette domain-containing protein [Caldilineae bacterium]
MITYDRFTYRYPDASEPVLRDLTLNIPEGAFVLVMGPSGAGKSTFLRTVNGLAPHFYGGVAGGKILVGGRNPVERAPRGMADLVGMVFQDPESSFVVDVVEDELAFAMENFGLSQDLMRKRVEEALDQLKIAHLRRRPVSLLSGGEKQRVAIAAALTMQPDILVLDEPTSQLDPQAAEEVLLALRQLNEDLGLTVLLSEHRLERVAHYADYILYWPGGGQPPLFGEPAAILRQTPLTPPLITLAKALGWEPMPLTIKQGRKFARALKDQLRPAPLPETTANGHPPVIRVDNLWHSYPNRVEALRGVSLRVHAGEFVALMGRNGSGKTTLLKHLVGLLKPARGQVQVLGMDASRTPTEEITRAVAYLPQNPGRLLFTERVADELAFSRRAHGMPPDPEADRALLGRLGIAHLWERHPHDLSVGEQQRLALAAVLVTDPEVILLDEPTRGLDYVQKQELSTILRELRDAGKAILMATHDVELAAAATDRAALMAEGEIVVIGPSRRIMSESLVFASQVNKLFRDPRFLTPEDVIKALPERASSPVAR